MLWVTRVLKLVGLTCLLERVEPEGTGGNRRGEKRDPIESLFEEVVSCLCICVCVCVHAVAPVSGV